MSTFNIKFFTPVEVAELLGVKVQTLSVWRCNGRYPELRWHKSGRRIRYSEQDVYSFIQSALVVTGVGL
jgi:predicted site-specific integrase-resolvase